MVATILIVACLIPLSKQHPMSRQSNGFAAFAKQHAKYAADAGYCVNVNNAVCNLCHNNAEHQAMAIDSHIVAALIDDMDEHRGNQGREDVHKTGCMAIRNIASLPQAAVESKGLF